MTPDAGAPPGPNYEGKWRAFAAIAVAFVTNVLAMTMVFVALPSIADDFGVTLRAVAWVVIVQSLIVSSLMLPMGRVADMVGRRRMHLAGLTLFGAGAVAVILAPSFEWLIVARAVMSIGNAMGQSVGTAMAVALFPPEERGKAVGSQTTAVAIGAASGPIFGGLVLQVLPWEALFALLLIPISVAFVAGYLVLDEAKVTPTPSGPRPSFDWPGAIISAVMVVALVLTVNNPLALPWTSPTIVVGAVIVVVFLAAFVRWELRIPNPMLELRLFSNRVLTAAIGARLVGFMGATVSNFMAPIYLISLRGMSTAAAGGLMFLSSVGMAISAQVSGRLSDRYGPRLFGALGFIVLIVVSLVFAGMVRTTPMMIVVPAMLANGFSLGLWNVPTNTLVMGSVPAERHGVVGAFTNLTRNMGNVVGQAMASAIIVGIMVGRGFDIPLSEVGDTAGAGDAFSAGWRVSFLLATVFAVVGLGLSLYRPASSAPEMVPSPST